MAVHAEDHHGWHMALRPSWRSGDLPQTGGAKSLGAHLIRLVRSLCIDAAGADGDR